MPHLVRGSIYWHDYGPVIGSELSGRRPALVISNDKLNRDLSVAITLPMSTRDPGIHYRNHVFIQSTSSWASVRQIKTVRQGRLRRVLGQASRLEMDEILEILVERLANAQRTPGTISTASGNETIEPGTIWDIEFQTPDGSVQHFPMLILDYNDGNKMAIAMQIDFRKMPSSAIKVPVDILGSSQSATVLINRIRSIDVSERTTLKNQVVLEVASLTRVQSALRKAIDD